MADQCTIEIHLDGQWLAAGVVTLVDRAEKGIQAATQFEYTPDYLEAMTSRLNDRSYWAVSWRYPVSYELFSADHWPPFLLDIMPSGAARRGWENQLGLNNTPASDWELLRRGGGNPPGHLRVAEAKPDDEGPPLHEGFEYERVVERHENFIEYARQRGAPVSGSTGAGGDAPKDLLREDHEGRWHADGGLPDNLTKDHWLVKFPRGRRTATDCQILEAEQAYHEVAQKLGARTHGPVHWDRDCLFVKRFDRQKLESGATLRYGLESLCSILRIATFGASVPMEQFVKAIHRVSSRPQDDLREFVLRDVMNVAMGNTDNHGRNQAMLKYDDGTMELAPLFDFAPMFLDPSGIARVCRWSFEDGGGYPRWNDIIAWLENEGFVEAGFRAWMRGVADRVAEIPSLLDFHHAPSEVRLRCEDRVRTVAQMLNQVR